MIAISISDPNRIIEVELADRYVKKFQKNAKYMMIKPYATCVFYETLDFRNMLVEVIENEMEKRKPM